MSHWLRSFLIYTSTTYYIEGLSYFHFLSYRQKVQNDSTSIPKYFKIYSKYISNTILGFPNIYSSCEKGAVSRIANFLIVQKDVWKTFVFFFCRISRFLFLTFFRMFWVQNPKLLVFLGIGIYTIKISQNFISRKILQLLKKRYYYCKFLHLNKFHLLF